MNTCLFHVKVRMFLHGDGFLGIISGNILKYLSLAQWVALLVEACEPQPRRLRIKVICYTQIVLPNLKNETATLSRRILLLLLFLNLLLGEHASTIVVIIVIYVVQVNYSSTCSSLWSLLITTTNYLHTIFIIIKIQNLSSFSLFRVYCLNPSIFSVSL